MNTESVSFRMSRVYKGEALMVINNKLDRKNGLMTINQETFVQEGNKKPEVFKERWTMQIYSADELKSILKRNGFETLGQYGMDGSKRGGISILTVARKL